MRLLHAHMLAGLLAAGACKRAPSTPPTQPASSGLADSLPAGASSVSAITSFTRLPDSAGQHKYHLVNRRFLLTHLYQRDQGESQPLVREVVDQGCCNNGERETWATITLEGLGSLASPTASPRWSVRIEADEGAIWNQFYRAVLFGCCDQTDGLTYVNLLTGKVAFVTSRQWEEPNSDLPHLTVPNSGLERWAGFLDSYAPLRWDKAERDSNVVGVLQYGAGDQPGTQYFLLHAGRPTDYRLAKLEFTVDDKERTHGSEVQLWSANGKDNPSALSGFDITISLLGVGIDDPEKATVTLQVPVRADRIRPEGLHLPTGWSLHAALDE